MLFVASLLGSQIVVFAGGPLDDAAVQFRVENLSANGETRISNAAGVQLNADGLILTTATPFSPGASLVKVFAVDREPSKYARQYEVLFVDRQADIAVLRAPSSSKALSSLRLGDRDEPISPGSNYFGVEFTERSRGASTSSGISLFPVAPNKLQTKGFSNLSVGSPIATEQGVLVGLVSGVDKDGIATIKPISVNSIPPSVYASISGTSQNLNTALPSQQVLVVPITTTQDVHLTGTTLRRFQQKINAPSGARIIDASFSINSANKLIEGPAIQIAPDSKTAIVSYTLESGPLWNQWRGWLFGEVRLVLATDK